MEIIKVVLYFNSAFENEILGAFRTLRAADDFIGKWLEDNPKLSEDDITIEDVDLYNE